MNLSAAYSQNANVLQRPMVTGTEGNSYQYVSRAGGRKKNVSKRGCMYYGQRSVASQQLTTGGVSRPASFGGKSRKQKKNKGNKSRSKRKSSR